ncbi:MAG: prepilin peptidase [Candidatus Diapherotrites archaeon]|nr:prepilin peptidase [Candidatus Diapherotrites archaeon]
MLFYLPLLVFIFSFSGLLIASYTDLKERIVSNKLCFLLALSGLLLHIFFSVYLQTTTPFLYSVFALIYTFLFSYILYKLGFWAGGDVKLFSAIAALNPVNPNVFALISNNDIYFLQRTYRVFPLFPFELFIFTIFSMFPISLLIMLKCAEKRMREKIISLIALSIILPLIAFFLGLDAGAALTIFLFIFSAILIASMPLARVLLIKEKKITELKEGDIVGETIKLVNGKAVREKHFNIGMLINYMAMKKTEMAKVEKEIVSPLNARGVTDEEINELKKLVSKNKLEDSILVKESVPMVPAILFAYILLNIFGDIIWSLI